jgi:Ion channel
MVPLLAGVLAALLLFVVLQDAFEVMLLPRRVPRRLRLVRWFFQITWAAFSRLALPLPSGERRERLLSLYGPLSMVLLFTLWAVALIAGFGVLEWALETGTRQAASFAGYLYMSGTTFFTLGYGDLVPHTRAARLISVAEAGTGLGFIAVVIGYLPVLYQLFSRREAHVIQLDGRAGSPPTAAALLCRHAEGGGLEGLNGLLREWEIWGSELLESHLSYPMLAYYRSQHYDQSWLAALAAITDTCALVLVGLDGVPPLQARMTFTMARQVLVEMTRSFGIAPSRYTGGDRLPHATYVRMETAFAEAGLAWRGGPDTEETLAALRATYEPLLDALASHLLVPLQGWIAHPDATDHWAAGPRGLIAGHLIGQLSEARAGVQSNQSAAAEEEALWRRLHTRLRRPGADGTSGKLRRK